MSKESTTCSVCKKKSNIVLVETGLSFFSQSFFCDYCISSSNSWSIKKPLVSGKKETIFCDTCGTDISNLKSDLLASCSNCYIIFADFISEELGDFELIEEQQTKDKDFISVNLCVLNNKLKEAIKSENYEKAAEIRDHINTILKESYGK